MLKIVVFHFHKISFEVLVITAVNNDVLLFFSVVWCHIFFYSILLRSTVSEVWNLRDILSLKMTKILTLKTLLFKLSTNLQKVNFL